MRIASSSSILWCLSSSMAMSLLFPSILHHSHSTNPFQQAQPPYQRLDVQWPALAPAPTRSSPIPVDGNDDDVVAAFFFLEDCRGAAKRRKTTAVDPRPRHCHRKVLEPTGPKGYAQL
jgi:hypothetical protein